MRQANKAQSMTPKMKFGVEVPRNYKDALRLDQVNRNKLWQDAINNELDQIMGYNTFKDHGMNMPLPEIIRESLFILFLMLSLI